MKKSSFLLLILMVLITSGVLHYNNHKEFSFNRPPVYENTAGYLKFPQVGDLYVVRNSEPPGASFFKIAGNPKEAEVYILNGYNTQPVPKKESFSALYKLMINNDNYQEQISTISQTALQKLATAPTTSLTIYRQSQKPNLTFKRVFFNSPVGFYSMVLILLLFLWGLKSSFLVAKHRFTLLENPYIIYLSTAITTVVFVGLFAAGNTFLYSWGLVLLFYVLSILPITYVFNYTNQHFFSKLAFFDSEINKFFCIFIIGFLFQSWAYFGINNIVDYFNEIPQKSFFYYEYLGLPPLVLVALFGWFCIATINFLYNFNARFFNYQQQVKELGQAKMNELQSQAELDALHARVNPHFLYNSLNSIAGLAQEDPEKTEEMAIALSHFFKYSTNRQTENWSTVEEEIEILETYLNIEKIRFGERLQYEIQCEDNLKQAKTPRFLLQPLVENAIKYGYQSETNSIDIKVVISQLDGELSLAVYDGGQPFPEQMPSGYGVQSVRKKLALLLPEAHELAFINEPQKHVAIVLY